MPRPLARLVAALALAAACADPLQPDPPAARPDHAVAAPDRLPRGTPVVGTPIDFPRFGGWAPVLDASFDSGPATDGYFVVARGTDGRLYATPLELDWGTREYGYGPWTPVGDGLTSRPAIATYPVHEPGSKGDWPPYLLGSAVAARRDDGNLWVMSRGPYERVWTGWHRLPAGVFGAPAIAYASPYLYVVARGRDGGLHWTRQHLSRRAETVPAGGWSAWAPVPGGAVHSDPGALGTPGSSRWYSGGESVLHIVATRADGRAWRNRMEDRGTFVFSGWVAIPGALTGHAPSISGDPTARMDVAVRGLFDDVWLASSEDGGATWTPFRSVGGVGTSPPAVWSIGWEDVSVLVRGTDGRAWHRYTRTR